MTLALACGSVISPDIELTVIVPTFNERANVRELLSRLNATLQEVRWEIIFVDDDSPDGTADLVRQMGMNDHRVRCLQRIGRRGLSSACIEGMLASCAPYLAVLDGDLQHDETLLSRMIEILRHDDADIVIGSRYISGGTTGNWNNGRIVISRFATRLSKTMLRAELTDPLSGFFMMRQEVFHSAVRRVSGVGFKILLDLFASSPRPLRFKELPYRFRNREAGDSKLDSRAVWDYLMLLLDKLIGHVIPIRFVAFALVGSLGVVWHILTLSLLFSAVGMSFLTSHSLATLAAMTSNFTLNNLLTYSDVRLRRWAWLRGWLSFTLVCAVGALANVAVASYLFGIGTFWLLSALAGVIVGACWNYAVTSVYTWPHV